MFIIPIEKRNHVHATARVVQALILLNVVVFVITGFGVSRELAWRFGFVPASPSVVGLFSHMFLHGGFLHLLGNMFFLWMFGDNIEDALGHALFAISYLLSGFGAVLGQYLAGPHSFIPMVGASGAVSGLMGLYILFFPKAEFDLHVYLGWWRLTTRTATSKGAVGAWLAEQVFLGAITSVTHSVGIAFWAHVGGFLAGAIVGGVLLMLGCKERFEKRISTLAVPAKSKRAAAP